MAGSRPPPRRFLRRASAPTWALTAPGGSVPASGSDRDRGTRPDGTVTLDPRGLHRLRPWAPTLGHHLGPRPAHRPPAPRSAPVRTEPAATTHSAVIAQSRRRSHR